MSALKKGRPGRDFFEERRFFRLVVVARVEKEKKSDAPKLCSLAGPLIFFRWRAKEKTAAALALSLSTSFRELAFAAFRSRWVPFFSLRGGSATCSTPRRGEQARKRHRCSPVAEVSEE